MIPALQASRRAAPAERRTPVSRPAEASPSRRCWWSRCTSTPTPTRAKPPALPSGLVGRCSSSSVNPSPIRSDQDRFWAPVLTSRVSSVTGSPSRPRASRRGEVICSSQARSRWPCSSGITNRPRRCRRRGPPASATSRSPHAAPRPRSSVASCSSASRRSRAASARAISAVAVSSIRRAAWRSRRASVPPTALTTSPASAARRCSRVEPAGSCSAAVTITRAWASLIAPSAKASRVAAYRSASSRPSHNPPATTARVLPVRDAAQASVPVAPSAGRDLAAGRPRRAAASAARRPGTRGPRPRRARRSARRSRPRAGRGTRRRTPAAQPGGRSGPRRA